MDGLTIAAAIVQFIDVAGKVVSSTTSIRRSIGGQLDEHRELEEITSALAHDARKIRECIQQRRDAAELTDAEKEQEKIGQDCQDVADQLLYALGKLKARSGKKKAERHKQSQWQSFRQALRILWREDEICALEKRLDRFRQQMVFIILGTLRQKAEAVSQQQSSILETVTQIKQQMHTQSIGRAFLRELDDGERWRQDLIQAIHRSETPKHKGRGSSVVDEESAARIQAAILQSLRFREMADREYRIPKAHHETFKWIFENQEGQAEANKPRTGFKAFLDGYEDQLYWITGKPGSGKSTLMKYLRHHPDLLGFLKTWAGGHSVVFSHFYFWNSGSDMQMTVEGLLQTLLYECLKQMPSAVRAAFPERWEVFCLLGEDDYPLRWHELSTALRKLILEVGREQNFFIMIDGLDECAGDQSRLTDLALELINSGSNLKICVASRPWTNFEDCFQGRPRLKLEDLTLDDIKKYVASKFEACEGYHELAEREQEYAEDLLRDVSDKAEGVFLWVHLVVSSLVAGLTNGDRMCDLQRRLDGLPPRLEDLFERMLDGLEPRYMSHASQLFQLVRASNHCPTLLGLAFADFDDRTRVLRSQVKPLSREQKMVYCKNMKRKLMSRCRGLLEATAHKPGAWSGRGHMTEDAYEQLWNGSNSSLPGLPPKREPFEKANLCDDCDDDMFTLRVQYLHRTVKDYIETPKVWKWLLSANNDPTFSPHLNWLESQLAQIKGLDPECLTSERFWDHVSWCLNSAKLYEKNCVTFSDAQARLLDELNLACTSLFLSTCQDGTRVAEKLMGPEDRDSHWTATLVAWIPRPTFLYLIAMCGMHRYIDSRMSSVSAERRKLSGEVEDEETASLLFAPTDDFLALQRFEGRKSLITETPYQDTVEVLLRKGEDPYAFFHGRSPWTVAKAMADRDEVGYEKIAELYIKVAGQPPAHHPTHSSNWNRRHAQTNPNGSGVRIGTNSLTPENLLRLPSDRRVGKANDLSSATVLAEYEFEHQFDTRPKVDTFRSRPNPGVSRPRSRPSRRMHAAPSARSSSTSSTETGRTPPTRTRHSESPEPQDRPTAPYRHDYDAPRRRPSYRPKPAGFRSPSPQPNAPADESESDDDYGASTLPTKPSARNPFAARKPQYQGPRPSRPPPSSSPNPPTPLRRNPRYQPGPDVGGYYVEPHPPYYPPRAAPREPFYPPPAPSFPVRTPAFQPVNQHPEYARPPRYPPVYGPRYPNPPRQTHAEMGGYGPDPLVDDLNGSYWREPGWGRQSGLRQRGGWY